MTPHPVEFELYYSLGFVEGIAREIDVDNAKALRWSAFCFDTLFVHCGLTPPISSIFMRVSHRGVTWWARRKRPLPTLHVIPHPEERRLARVSQEGRGSMVETSDSRVLHRGSTEALARWSSYVGGPLPQSMSASARKYFVKRRANITSTSSPSRPKRGEFRDRPQNARWDCGGTREL